MDWRLRRAVGRDNELTQQEKNAKNEAIAKASMKKDQDRLDRESREANEYLRRRGF